MNLFKARRGRSRRTKGRQIKKVISFCQFKQCSENLIKEIQSPNKSTEEFLRNDSYLNEKVNNVEKNNESITVDYLSGSSVVEHNVEKNMVSPEDLSQKQSLREELRIWSLDTKVANSSVDYLLQILKRHGHDELPGSSRTLKQTPRKLFIRDMGTGRFWFFGVIALLEMLEAEGVILPTKLTLNTNVDGVPLFASSKAVF